MKHGLNYVGIELEQKFVDLGNQNIALWNKRYGQLPRWGTAVLLQGDSRQLAQVLSGADAAISSPPYADSISNQSEVTEKLYYEDGKNSRWSGTIHPRHYSHDPDNLGNLPATPAGLDAAISSPPYAEARIGQESGQEQCGHNDAYGGTPGQLGAMKAQGFDAAISSPPYADSIGNEQSGIDWSKQADRDTERPHGYNGEGYGGTGGQLGAMKAGGFDGAISSPPFVQSNPDGGWQMLGKYAEQGKLTVKQVKGDPNKSYPSWSKDRDTTYAPSPENVGNLGGSDFWTAARAIVDQVYGVLKPGGHAIWITKRFAKDKKIVEFSQQWEQMCEAAGFQLVHWHKAWLVEDRGTQYGLFGDAHQNVTKRYSFFRRMHARKYPELEIQYEDVICMVKPR